MDRVFVLSKTGQPLMPTRRFGKVRRLLKDGRAIVVSHAPFTIQLQYESTEYVQPVTLGIDAGYETIGYSAVSDKEELIGGEVKMLKGMSERLKERAMYRRQRRSRKRHRPARFDFRKKGKVGWLAPSIQHKLDTHKRLIAKIKTFLPISKTIIEVANFDVQAIKNPDIAGVGYQQGEQMGYWNLREYILHRDEHKCQNPDCQHTQPILQVHHLGYWQKDRTDRPANLITLCIDCHTPANHQPGGLLWGWQPKLKNFRPETFMTTVRWRLTEGAETFVTYGYITKSERIAQGLEKSHHNDAFVIAGGIGQTRCEATDWEQLRRHNHNLEQFYDARYIDLRDGQEKSGQELSSGRRVRNRNSARNRPNLRQFRARRATKKDGSPKKGQRRIRKQRYSLGARDIVEYAGERWKVKGNISNGQGVALERLRDGLKKYPSPRKVTLIWKRRGLVLAKAGGKALSSHR